MNRTTMYAIMVIIGLTVVVVIGIYFVAAPAPGDGPTQVFTSEEECQAATNRTCVFEMCDYVPAGMTPEQACPPNGPYKGWVAPSGQ